MKFFYDTEFIEGFQRNRIAGIGIPEWLSKPKHSIQLISIGIVAEDGRSYSAISNEYRYEDASQWVKDNVIMPLYRNTVHGDRRNYVDVHNFHKFYGISNEAIADGIREFVCPFSATLYGYYSAYDHVLLASLFGTMMDLPNGIPMYTIDLQQMLYDNAETILNKHFAGWVLLVNKDFNSMSKSELINIVKSLDYFPKNDEEHSAIYDSIFNKKLYEFIVKYT